MISQPASRYVVCGRVGVISAVGARGNLSCTSTGICTAKILLTVHERVAWAVRRSRTWTCTCTDYTQDKSRFTGASLALQPARRGQATRRAADRRAFWRAARYALCAVESHHHSTHQPQAHATRSVSSVVLIQTSTAPHLARAASAADFFHRPRATRAHTPRHAAILVHACGQWAWSPSAIRPARCVHASHNARAPSGAMWAVRQLPGA